MYLDEMIDNIFNYDNRYAFKTTSQLWETYNLHHKSLLLEQMTTNNDRKIKEHERDMMYVRIEFNRRLKEY